MSAGGAATGSAPAAVDTAARGWFLQPRSWRDSDVYRALRTAEARHVAELVLFDRPRYQDEEHMFGTVKFIVHRGELFDSEETLAKRAGTSRKVLRTVLEKLEKSGLIGRRKVHPAGQCPHVITVLHYEASQRLPGYRGPANGTANGPADGPADGPAKGPQGNEGNRSSNPNEPHERFARALSNGSVPATDRTRFRDGIVNLEEVEP
jgi:hypothetical protein